MLVRPDAGEALVRLPHREILVEATKLGCSLHGIHQNILRIEEEELAQFLDINRSVAPVKTINAVAYRRIDGLEDRYYCGYI